MVAISNYYINDFNLLNGRQRGDLYYVENDHLKKMGLFQRCAYTLSRLFSSLFGSYADRVAREVKEVIGKMTRELDGDKKILERFYFEKMSTMSQRVYGRDLKERVLEVLGPVRTLPKGASKQYQVAYKAAQLWARLGNFELLGGSCGSYRIFDGKGTSLGVCKFSDEEQLSPNNPRFLQKVKRKLYPILFRKSMVSLSRCTMGQACLAEAMNYRLAKRIDPSLVPETHVVNIGLRAGKARRGSFQLWIQEQRQTASEFLGVTESYKGKVKRPIPDALFDLMAIFDFETGNHDRHGSNWFVLLDDEKRATGIKLIDGGTSLSPFHPQAGSTLLLRNQYLWRKLPQAQRPFGEEAQETIEKLFAERYSLAESVRRFYDRYLPNDRAENALRGALVQERIEALYQCRDRTLAEIGEIRTEDDFKKLSL